LSWTDADNEVDDQFARFSIIDNLRSWWYCIREERRRPVEIIVWLIVIPLGWVLVVAWLLRIPDGGALPAALRRVRNQAWGESHRIGHGKLWEPGEQEVYRAQLRGVTTYSIDRHILIQRRATCIITTGRLVAYDGDGHILQLRAHEVRSTRVQRTYDVAEGFSYAVVLERTGSTVHDPDGDIRLLCAGQEQCRDLARAVEDALALVPA
jgi:hypothetical protein